MNRFIVLTIIGARIRRCRPQFADDDALPGSLGASYAYISIILTSYTATALIFNYAWGRISDVAGGAEGIPGAGLGRNGSCQSIAQHRSQCRLGLARAYPRGASMAAYGTISLALMGDLLEQESAGTAVKAGAWGSIAG